MYDEELGRFRKYVLVVSVLLLWFILFCGDKYRANHRARRIGKSEKKGERLMCAEFVDGVVY